MTSRSQKQKRPSKTISGPHKKPGLLDRAKGWEAGREMSVARGQADASRTKNKGALGIGSKDKLKLGRAAAKGMIAATRKKNKALKGK